MNYLLLSIYSVLGAVLLLWLKPVRWVDLWLFLAGPLAWVITIFVLVFREEDDATDHYIKGGR